jgi:hypothetical protein
MHWRLVLLLLKPSVAAAGASPQRTIAYSSDTQSYSLSYDGNRFSGYDMSQLVWLSPWYHPDVEGRYWVGFSSEVQNGQTIVDKIMMARPLESGIGVPNAESLGESDYLARALRNLQRNRADVEAIRTLKVPPELEPVRTYLAESFRSSLPVQELRDEFIKSGRTQPLRQALCDRCPCGKHQEEIVGQLERALDFSQRRDISWSVWPTAMNRCHRTGSLVPHSGVGKVPTRLRDHRSAYREGSGVSGPPHKQNRRGLHPGGPSQPQLTHQRTSRRSSRLPSLLPPSSQGPAPVRSR